MYTNVCKLPTHVHSLVWARLHVYQRRPVKSHILLPVKLTSFNTEDSSWLTAWQLEYQQTWKGVPYYAVHVCIWNLTRIYCAVRAFKCFTPHVYVLSINTAVVVECAIDTGSSKQVAFCSIWEPVVRNYIFDNLSWFRWGLIALTNKKKHKENQSSGGGHLCLAEGAGSSLPTWLCWLFQSWWVITCAASELNIPGFSSDVAQASGWLLPWSQREEPRSAKRWRERK